MRFSDRKKTLSDSTPKPNADCSFRRRLPTFPSDINRHLRSKASTKQQSKVSITDLIFSHRMNKLLDDENEEDETFWNQEALKEEENDENYEEEGEVVDVFDSDFDDDEPQPDEEVENEADDRMRTKKRLIFPGKQLPKKKTKKKVLSNLGKAPQDDETAEQSTLPEHHDAPDDVEVERIVRKSTRTSVIVRQAERDAIRAALQATMKPIKRKKEGEEKRMTQEEMLLEAAQTGNSYLEFSKGLLFQSEISTVSTPCKSAEGRVCGYWVACEVRFHFYLDGHILHLNLEQHNYRSLWLHSYGIPFNSLSVAPCVPHFALGSRFRYRDPKTGLPFATKEAFRTIRERQGCGLGCGLLWPGLRPAGKAVAWLLLAAAGAAAAGPRPGTCCLMACCGLPCTMPWAFACTCTNNFLSMFLALQRAQMNVASRFLEENRNAREKKSLGFLSEEISGQGFSERRKRSVIPNRRETSDFRYSARFLQIPALESQVSE
ncbi:hypothetical protein TEA_022886 [Camellia sinensis var. sinensis]|uniref:Uncharacterized protein n=1 Tax=Camellia sinensis var. sinensis TaxID=542762 RepID=A0A4S4DUL3_CAMSN|nr:hypothetical protein TEA_022886 [Camellia sinensis var. sinensis]